MISKFKNFQNIIKKYNSFAIVSHLNPDGDNLGSIISLYYFLSDLGKNVYPLELDIIPNDLLFLTKKIPFTNDVNIEVDVLIAVDCGDKKRLGNIDNIFNNAKEVVSIDHHIVKEYYGTLNLVDPYISSTCELITNFLIYSNASITKEIATPLLTGILTDTGRFLYERSTSETLKTSAKLMDFGADKNYIVKQLFQYYNLNSLKAINEINEKAKFFYNNKLVVTVANKSLLKKYNVSIPDIDQAINYYRDCKEVEVSCLIKEIDKNNYKISFRSKNYINVSEIAATFGGGGHKFAAGCTLSGDLENILNKIIERFKKIDWK